MSFVFRKRKALNKSFTELLFKSTTTIKQRLLYLNEEQPVVCRGNHTGAKLRDGKANIVPPSADRAAWRALAERW